MESSLKLNFVSKKNAKIASVAIVSTMAVMGGFSNGQIVKNNDEKTEESNEPTKENVLDELSHDELIKLLSHDKYSQRQKAHERIWRIGKSIIPALEKASETDDPEVVVRVTEILRNLRIGVTYDTPKHIADKVSEFQAAHLDKQDDILRFLFQEKAYNQMVYMLAEMENRVDAEKLHKGFRQLPFLAAREQLSKDNVKGAIELLKMSPQSDAVRRSLAFVYARTGLALEESERLAQVRTPNDGKDEWRLMLLEEMNDRDKLREFAHKNKISPTLDALDLLEGEPINLVKSLSRTPNAVQATGISIVKDIYAGKSPAEYADKHMALLKDARHQSKSNKFMALDTLFLTGGNRLAEGVLLEVAPTKAFLFLDERERPAEALAALSIVDDASLIKWRDPLITKIITPKDDAKEKALRRELDPNNIDEELHILEVASLYVGHGAEDKARLILDPLVTALYELEDKERWINLMADLPSYNMHGLAMHYISASKNDEDIKQMIDILFDGSEASELVWKELEKREKSIKENFIDMGVLMGMYQGKQDHRATLEKELINASRKNGLGGLRSMQNALYQLADYRYDSVSASKYIKEVLKIKTDEETGRSLIQEAFGIAALNLNWKKLISMFEENPEFGAKSSEWLAVRSVAERELGNEDKADKLLDKAILLTVGQIDDINDVFIELVYSGDMKRATDLIERELIINASATESYPFIRALGILANGDSHYLLSGKWEVAAAMAYVSNIVSISYLQDTISEPGQLTEMMRMNFVLNFARGMYFSEQGQHDKAKELLKNANECIVGDGALADIFYPAVNKTPYKKEYEQMVQRSYDHISSCIMDFPKGANTRNTMAWILSRSERKLDEAVKQSSKALEFAPNEAAYLDTMAETWFAKGDRKKATEWGEKAVFYSKSGRLITRASQSTTKARTLSLYGQLKRFRTAPISKK